MVLSHINMHPPWAYMCSPSWPPSHLPPYTIPPGHPSAPAPSILYRTWTSDSFLIWYYTCFSAIPPNRPTLSLVAQRIKHLPAVQETRVRSLGWEDPLEKEMATHSSILAWRIPWTEEPGGLQSTGSQRVRHDWATSHTSHTLPLPQSPKDCSIHLCLFCCLAYRVVITIFLNSIYMH